MKRKKRIFGVRKTCLLCLRKRNLENMEVSDIKKVEFVLYKCGDKTNCLIYQVKNKKKK